MAVISQQSMFKGKNRALLIKVLLYMIVTELLISFLLMGSEWNHVFAVFLIVSAPIVLIYVILMSYLNCFAFDDQRDIIARPWRRHISYKNIRTIYLIQKDGTLTVRIKQPRPWKTTLVRSFVITEKDRLLEEIAKRFPQETIQEKKVAEWRNLVVIAAAITLLGLAYHAFFFHSHRNLLTAPKQIDFQNNFAPNKSEKTYNIKSFRFTLPKRFQEEQKEGDNIIFFSNKKEGVLTRVVYHSEKGPVSRGELLLSYGTGMKDFFDLLCIAYPARFGVIPLLLKEMVLGDLTDTEVYEFRGSSLKGFIMRGKSDKQKIAHLLLRDGNEKAKINFFFASQKDIPMDVLLRIAKSVQTKK
jgi:hypothetical protein